MKFPSINFSFARLVAAYTVLSAKSTFVNAGLCEDNADICELVTGGYTDHDGNTRPFWAFVPIGAAACPSEGCPLYVWIDGTAQQPYQLKPDQFYMLEMLKRGFVAVNVGYDAATFDYAAGCYGSLLALDFRGFTDKAQEIFDPSVGDSVVSQLCDGPAAIANCALGIASHGWSQGAHLAVLGGNYDSRVSASLLFGNGNDNSLTPGDLSCLDNGNLALPRERRRSIVGDSDDYFGGSFAGVLQQQKESTGYDCDNNRNCFMKLPDGCPYAEGEQACPEFGTYFTSSPNCPACNIVPASACPSNSGLQTNACPAFVQDTYIGNGAEIEATAGYYIISGDEYCSFLGCNPADGAPHGFFQNNHPDSDFLKPETVWGLKQNLDWLARTARNTAFGVTLSPTVSPTSVPSKSPSRGPTKSPAPPSVSPTGVPSKSPSHGPTKSPAIPTMSPSAAPSTSPSSSPTREPTDNPTRSPSNPPVDPCTDCSVLSQEACGICGGCAWKGKGGNAACETVVACNASCSYTSKDLCNGCGDGNTCSWSKKDKTCQ